MTPKIKKIIAREGLIILIFVFLGLLIGYVADFCNNYSAEFAETYKSVGQELPQYTLSTPRQMILRAINLCSRIDSNRSIGNKYCLALNDVGSIVLLFGYPIYLIIRFIIWAIRTLKDK